MSWPGDVGDVKSPQTPQKRGKMRIPDGKRCPGLYPKKTEEGYCRTASKKGGLSFSSFRYTTSSPAPDVKVIKGKLLKEIVHYSFFRSFRAEIVFHLSH